MTARTATDKYRKATRNTIREILGGEGPWEVKNPQTNEIIKAEVLDVENEIYSVVPSARMANYKYASAVTKMLFNECRGGGYGYVDFNTRKANDLNDIIKIIASAHENEYDTVLNGLSLDELLERYGTNVDDVVDDEKIALKGISFDGESDYDIVRIKSFDDAKAYCDYTNPNSKWCLTYMSNMFDSYSAGGMNAIYFALKKGYKDVKREKNETAPLDEYGLSMISVIVRPNGGLAFCTCRWNHENGGDDQVMNIMSISKIINRNFFDVFSPISPDELRGIIFKLYEEVTPNDECKKNGWQLLKNKKSSSYAYYDWKGGRIVRDNIVLMNDGATISGRSNGYNKLTLPNGNDAFGGFTHVSGLIWYYQNHDLFLTKDGMYNRCRKTFVKDGIDYSKIGTYYNDGKLEGLVADVDKNGEPTMIMSLHDEVEKDITWDDAMKLQHDEWFVPSKADWEKFVPFFPMFQSVVKKEGKGDDLAPLWFWSSSRCNTYYGSHWCFGALYGYFNCSWNFCDRRVRLFARVGSSRS